MIKVKFLQTCRFEDSDYAMGEVYEVSEETASALGDTVEILDRKEKKSAEKSKKEAPENKMVEEPEVQK